MSFVLACSRIQHRLLRLSKHVEDSYLLLFQETNYRSLLREVLYMSISKVNEGLSIEFAMIGDNRVANLLPKLLIFVARSRDILCDVSQRGELDVRFLELKHVLCNCLPRLLRHLICDAVLIEEFRCESGYHISV